VKRAALLVLLAARGGKAAAPHVPAVVNPAATAPAGDEVRVEPGAETRDCPAGLLESLSPVFATNTDGNAPRIDACLRGLVGGDAVVFVYASAPHPAGSESEHLYSIWRVLVTPGGALVGEGPPGNGDRILGGATLEALVDLDRDGTHEVVERVRWDPAEHYTLVWHVRPAGWVELTSFVSSSTEVSGCNAEWTVQDGALIVSSSGEDLGDQMRLDGAGPGCLDRGRHVFRLVDGALLEDAGE
jgi:hypothetical protein